MNAHNEYFRYAASLPTMAMDLWQVYPHGFNSRKQSCCSKPDHGSIGKRNNARLLLALGSEKIYFRHVLV
jgi:hypothetical protein